MPPPRNTIRCEEYSPSALREIVRTAAGRPAELLLDQVEYLSEYLGRLRASTILVEEHYVDRHYINELSRFYATCFNQPSHACWRLHFFRHPLLPSLDKGGFTEQDLDRLLSTAPESGSESWSQLMGQLSKQYLGFVVLRPLASVPVGRTVLVPLDDDVSRHFYTTVPYTVHVAGMELKVSALAFQQQDWAVAACATTAVWTALQRVARFEGARVPTPTEITDAAVRHSAPQGRPLPSPGLTLAQIADALNDLGFAPVCFRADRTKKTQFAMLLNIYLRSGIPVILTGKGHKGGHAITAVGYQSGPSPFPADDRLNGVAVKNLEYTKIYVHDDRIGPYARATLNTAEDFALTIERRGGDREEFAVFTAAPPLYGKLRTDAGELLYATLQTFPLVHQQLTTDVGLELFFQRSGTYLTSIFATNADRERRTAFMKTAALSRYVGISRWFVCDQPIIDFVWDTTDRIRTEAISEHLLALVCLDERYREHVENIKETYRPASSL